MRLNVIKCFVLYTVYRSLRFVLECSYFRSRESYCLGMNYRVQMVPLDATYLFTDDHWSLKKTVHTFDLMH